MTAVLTGRPTDVGLVLPFPERTPGPVPVRAGETDLSGTVVPFRVPDTPAADDLLLGDLAAEAVLTAADVAYLAGLNESTVSRLWHDPDWLERINGASLQALIVTIPGVTEQVAAHALGARFRRLASKLSRRGVTLDEQALAGHVEAISPQRLGNALHVVDRVLDGDTAHAAQSLARCWDLDHTHAIEALFRPDGILDDPAPLVKASTAMLARFLERPTSFHASLGAASLAHQLGRAEGTVPVTLDTSNTAKARQSALAWRAGSLAVLRRTDDDTNQLDRYLQALADNRILARIEACALPAQSGDIASTPSFEFPARAYLPRTARHLLDELEVANNAYAGYLTHVAVPNALRHDPSFGHQLDQLDAFPVLDSERASR